MSTIHSYGTTDLSQPSCVAIGPDPSLTNTVISTFKSALRPFISLYSGTMNKLYTGNWLTSSRVLSNRSALYINPPSLPRIRKEIQSLKANSHISIHTGCTRYVPHSTALVIGKDQNNHYYSLFFDPQGKKPSEAFLIYKDFEVIKEGRDQYQTIDTVEELYQEVMKGLKNPPPLKYSSSHIQCDWVTCVAYTSVFLKELEKAEKGDFNPEHFIQDVANHQLVTFTKVCDEVSNLYRMIQQEAHMDSLRYSETYKNSLDSEWDVIETEIPIQRTIPEKDLGTAQSSNVFSEFMKNISKCWY